MYCRLELRLGDSWHPTLRMDGATCRPSDGLRHELLGRSLEKQFVLIGKNAAGIFRDAERRSLVHCHRNGFWPMDPETSITIWNFTLDVVHSTPDVVHSTPDVVHSTPDVGHLTPDVGHLTHDVGHLTLDVGHLTPEVGRWTPDA